MDRQVEIKLITRAAAGDRDAAGDLVRAHQSSAYAYIVRISGRPDLAQDVVQEAFVRALTNLHRFDTRFRFSTWLFTIAKRVYLNWCDRCSASTGHHEGPAAAAFESALARAHPPEPPDAGALHDDARLLARHVLQGVLMMLSPEQREIIVLFHQHAWPIWLIAEHLDMPEGTVKSHLHRARARLRDLLRPARTRRDTSAINPRPTESHAP